MSQWYLSNNEKRLGPMSFDELYQLAKNGAFTGDNKVYDPRQKKWLAAREVIDLFPSAISLPPEAPPMVQQVNNNQVDLGHDSFGKESAALSLVAIVFLYIGIEFKEINAFLALLPYFIAATLSVILGISGFKRSFSMQGRGLTYSVIGISISISPLLCGIYSAIAFYK